MERHRIIGSDVSKGGVLQSIEHFILALQMERRCGRAEVIPDAVKLLEGITQILKEEERTNGK